MHGSYLSLCPPASRVGLKLSVCLSAKDLLRIFATLLLSKKLCADFMLHSVADNETSSVTAAWEAA